MAPRSRTQLRITPRRVILAGLANAAATMAAFVVALVLGLDVEKNLAPLVVAAVVAGGLVSLALALKWERQDQDERREFD